MRHNRANNKGIVPSQPIIRLGNIGDKLFVSNPWAQLSARPNDNASGQARFPAEHNSPLQLRRDNSQSSSPSTWACA
jgi:hypothetical protein